MLADVAVGATILARKVRDAAHQVVGLHVDDYLMRESNKDGVEFGVPECSGAAVDGIGAWVA